MQMSEKQQFPTHRVLPAGDHAWLEGPIVAPDKRRVARDLTDVHEILRADGAILVYAGEWMYLPAHAILRVQRGQRRVSLPWPLVTDEEPQ